MRWMLAMLWLAGCHVLGSPAANGEACDSDGDCESESCDGNICNGGSCGAGCGDGWECVHYDGGFFSDPYDLCEMKCGDAEPRCPEWYFCDADNHCDYEGIQITYSPAAPVANEPVTFIGHFLFADRPRRAANWLFETRSGIPQADGETATVTFEYPGDVTAVFTAAYADESTPMQTQLKLTIR